MWFAQVLVVFSFLYFPSHNKLETIFHSLLLTTALTAPDPSPQSQDKNDNYKKYFGSAGTSGLSGALNAVKAATGVGTEAFEELPPENLEQAEEHYLRCLGEADGLLKKLEQIEEVCRSQTTDPQSQLDHRTPMRLQSEANLGWGLSNARIADARLKASYKRFKKEVAGRLAKGGAEDTAEATKVFPIPCKEVGGNESKEDEGGNYPTPSWCMFQKPFAKENVRGEYLSLFKNGRVDTGSGTMMAEVEKQVQY